MSRVSCLPVFLSFSRAHPNPLHRPHQAEERDWVIGVGDLPFVGVAAVGVGFDHGEVEMEAGELPLAAGPIALIAQERTSLHKDLVAAGGKSWRDKGLTAVAGGHVGVVAPDLFAFGDPNRGHGRKVGVAQDDGAFPISFTRQIAIVGGDNGGDIDRAIRAEDVQSRMAMARAKAIIPAKANIAIGGEHHQRVATTFARFYRPVGMTGRVGKPGA